MNELLNTNGILQTTLWNVRQTAQRLGLAADIQRRIIDPKEQIQGMVHPILPGGGMLHAQFFLVRHNDVLGPAKGGIRMTASVGLDEITGLAMEMTWKTSLIGVPFGGGKAGILYDPARLTATEKEILLRAFTRSVHRHLGPEIYVPAPDMGTNEHDMGHICDCVSYSAGTAITNGCFVTGKPVVLGGIVGRREATGNGVAATVGAACRTAEPPPLRFAGGRAGIWKRRQHCGPRHRPTGRYRGRRLRPLRRSLQGRRARYRGARPSTWRPPATSTDSPAAATCRATRCWRPIATSWSRPPPAR